MLFLFLIWHILIFFKIPHLTWIPGFLNTWLFSQGLIPYKDFVDPHFPLTYLILYPFFLLTKWNLETDPILALVIAIVTCILIYSHGRVFLSKTAMGVSLFFFSIFYWYFSTWVQISQEAIQGLILLLITFFLINLKSNISYRSSFLLGLSLAILELSGQVVTPTVLIIILILLYKTSAQDKIFQHVSQHLALLTAGIILPVVILFSYFMFRGALTDFFFWNIPYYLTYAKLNQTTFSSLPWSDILIFFSPLAVLMLLTLDKKLPKASAYQVRLLLFLGLSTIPTIIFSVFHPHHFLFALPLLSICAGLASQMVGKSSTLAKTLGAIVGIFTLYFLITSLVPWYGDKAKESQITILSDINRDTNQKEAVNWISANTPLDSRILVAGDPLFYFRANRLPSNNRFSALPWHYLPLEETEKTMKNRPPRFWVINEGYMTRLRSGWKTPEIAEYIEGKLMECYHRVFSNSGWQIWQRSCPS